MNSTGTVVGIVLLIILVVLLFGGAGMMGFGVMGPWMMAGYGGMTRGFGTQGFGAQGFGYSPWWTIVPLVLWSLIILGIVLLVVWLVRSARRGNWSAPSSNPALEILKTRYAKGEITKEQYEEMRRVVA